MDSSILSLDVIASSLAIALSTAGLAAAATKDDTVSRTVVADPSDDQFMWSVATVVSFVPYFNWTVCTCPCHSRQ